MHVVRIWQLTVSVVSVRDQTKATNSTPRGTFSGSLGARIMQMTARANMAQGPIVIDSSALWAPFLHFIYSSVLFVCIFIALSIWRSEQMVMGIWAVPVEEDLFTERFFLVAKLRIKNAFANSQRWSLEN
jgi:hypothetical protein